MPARRQTQQRVSMQKYIGMLYEKPALKFLKGGEPWEDLADLIFGPDNVHTDPFFNEDVRQAGFKRLAELEQLWRELRSDILRAQQEYQPNKKPWGVRFD
jgi:hypothetical protein